MATITVEDGTGLSTANSYCTVAEADSYHGDILYATTWTASSTKEEALIQATRLLDEHVAWEGMKNTKEQALRWPRSYVYGPDGYVVANDSVPQWLKNATSELARHLLISDRTAEASTKGFKRLKLGDMELHVSRNDRISVIPPSVWSMISSYGHKSSKSKILIRA